MPSYFAHYLRIRDAAELDAEPAGWVRESYYANNARTGSDRPASCGEATASSAS